MLDVIDRMLEGTKARVGLMIGRCVLLAVADGQPLQNAQARLLADEEHDDMERVQQYGLTSVPLRGAEGVVVFVGGNRDHGVLIAVDDRRYRLKGLDDGEVALYDDQGQKVHLTRAGIVVDGAGKDVQIVNAPTVHMDGNLQVAGDITAGGEVSDQGGAKSMSGMRSVYDGHNHAENDSGGPTDPPNQPM